MRVKRAFLLSFGKNIQYFSTKVKKPSIFLFFLRESEKDITRITISKVSASLNTLNIIKKDFRVVEMY